MIVKGSIECPVCGGPFKAWSQPSVKIVLGPTCGTEVDAAAVEVQPEPTVVARHVPAFTRVLGLIWHRMVGYNGGRLAS